MSSYHLPPAAPLPAQDVASGRNVASRSSQLPEYSQRPLADYFRLPKKKNILIIKPASPKASDTQNGALPAAPSPAAQATAKTVGTPTESPPSQPTSGARREPPSRAALGRAAQSDLNIYAPVHVPDWLIGINQSVATQVACLQLQSFDAHDYAISFGAAAHIEPIHPRPPLPQGAWRGHLQTLLSQNYESFFSSRLQDDMASLGRQLAHYSLFQHHVTLKDPRQMLYEIRVPGLRENSPRIDLGDSVLVRPINPLSPAAAISQNKMWRERMQSRGLPHPAFLGIEYRAVVWGIHRATETVVLRIDNHASCPPTANFRFVVQAHKTEPLLHAVHSVGVALSSSETLRPMLFPEHSDACMQTKLSPATFNLAWWDESLNFEQQKAVANIVAARYGAVPYLISGPPGTGKTKTIVETALQLVARKTSGVHSHLLICAPSDAAADTLALRLSLHLNKDQLFRLNGWSRTFAEVPDKLMLYSYTAPNNMFSLPPFHQLMSYSVVVTTCRDASMLVEARLTNKDLAQLAFYSLNAVSPSTAKSLTTPLLHWTALLLDEAAQATEPESLIPLSVMLPLWQPPECQLVCPQFILAGDEFQLGPRLASQVQRTGLETSLFQRLFSLPFYSDHPLSRANGLQPLTRKLLPLPRAAFTNLIRNYRSHPAILAIPSSLFYYDTLIPEFVASSSAVTSWPGWRKPGWPVIFMQNNGPDEVDDILVGDGTGAGSLYNDSEIRLVSRHVRKLLDQIPDLKYEEIMVMSPFRAQVARIRTALRREGLAAVNVGPLEAFQGLESRIVIFCTTRTRRGKAEGEEDKFVKMDQERGLGVIDEPKRFNVAVTRAMEGLIVIGDARTLVCTGDKCWKRFVSFCTRNGLVDGDLVVREAKMSEWDVGEARLERALRRKGQGSERDGAGVIGLRGFVEDGEEEGEMILPETDDEEEGEEGEEGESAEESGDEEEEEEEIIGDEYRTLEALDLEGAVM